MVDNVISSETSHMSPVAPPPPKLPLGKLMLRHCSVSTSRGNLFTHKARHPQMIGNNSVAYVGPPRVPAGPRSASSRPLPQRPSRGPNTGGRRGTDRHAAGACRGGVRQGLGEGLQRLRGQRLLDGRAVLDEGPQQQRRVGGGQRGGGGGARQGRPRWASGRVGVGWGRPTTPSHETLRFVAP